MIRFTVYGTPIPQGSSRAFIPKGWKRPVITSANPKLKSWRQDLASAALSVINPHAGLPIEKHQPVRLLAIFYFAKPKSAKRQHLKVTKLDVDKLLRAVFDGLEGIIYEHDAQIVDARAAKFYGLPERVEIAVGLASEGEIP